MTLEGKTLFISGGSRGIDLAIAIRAARDGANVALIAKTAEPNPKLEGTVYTAAAQIEAAGGQALPVVGDIRDEAQVERTVDQAVERFGGIDVCVNNAAMPSRNTSAPITTARSCPASRSLIVFTDIPSGPRKKGWSSGKDARSSSGAP
jgi:NAD(P)-dependent dehydrogenase (short-subunit alcohol dehydrogenase family)